MVQGRGERHRERKEGITNEERLIQMRKGEGHGGRSSSRKETDYIDLIFLQYIDDALGQHVFTRHDRQYNIHRKRSLCSC